MPPYQLHFPRKDCDTVVYGMTWIKLGANLAQHVWYRIRYGL